MLSRTFSAAIQGVDAYAVEIEVNATGIGEDAKTIIVGLPDAVVRESRERVSSALMASGFFQPYGRTTINLAPADVALVTKRPPDRRAPPIRTPDATFSVALQPEFGPNKCP